MRRRKKPEAATARPRTDSWQMGRPALAATAPAPKITAGARSGRMIRGRISPPRFSDKVRLAPIAPTALTAGVPIRSERNKVRVGAGAKLNSSASSGETRVSGRPVERKCASILASDTLSSDKGDSAITSRLPSSKSPWNSRSSESSAASTAATQSTPPATRVRILRSAPMPSGISVATRAKNPSASAAPPPLRAARRRSRARRALNGFISGPPA